MANAKLIQACRLHVRLAHDIIKAIPGATGPTEAISAALFLRSLQAFEGAVLLAEQNMWLEVGNSARTILEAQFIMRKVRGERDWANTFIKTALRSQESLINSIIGLGKRALRKLQQFKGIKERLKEVQSDPLYVASGDLILQNIAYEIKQETDYVLKYRPLSIMCSHVTPDCLGQFLEIDSNGKPVAIHNLPRPYFKDEALMLAGKAFEEITKDLIEVHSINIENFVGTWNEIANLLQEYKGGK